MHSTQPAAEPSVQWIMQVVRLYKVFVAEMENNAQCTQWKEGIAVSLGYVGFTAHHLAHTAHIITQ